MRNWRYWATRSLLTVLVFAASLSAQISAPGVPRVITLNGTLQNVAGPGMTGITFALYADQHAAAPLWVETQSIHVEADGKFVVSLGANHIDGVPMALFATGQAQWLGIQGDGQPEQERVLLASVPYAAKAGDAQTLGGKPLSAFLLASAPATAETAVDTTTTTISAKIGTVVHTAAVTGPVAGVPNYIPKFADTTNLVNSTIMDAGGRIGIGTASPETLLDVVGNSGQMVKIGSVPWSFRFGSLQSGTQFIGVAVKKTAANNNYIATSADIATVNHTAMEFHYDGSWRIKQQAHQPDGTILNLSTSLALTSAGNFGVGVAQPAEKMEVTGNVKINGTGNGIIFPDGSVQKTAMTQSNAASIVAGDGMIVSSAQGSALIGLNTAYTDVRYAALATKNVFNTDQVFNQNLSVNGTLSSASQVVTGDVSASGSVSAANVQGHANAAVVGGVGVSAIADAEDATALNAAATGISGATTGIHATVSSPAGTAAVFDNLASGSGTLLLGRVKIGEYWVKRFRVDGSGRAYANNGYATGGADFAESFAVFGTKAEYEPGDVLIIDTTGKRRLARTSQPYSTLVAGIYSTRPGVMASPYDMDDENLKKEIPLAVVGVVPCKVTAENGPISTGDLLVTASISGYAMKGTDRGRMLGAVVGKALQPLESGTGVIEVLVSLQ